LSRADRGLKKQGPVEMLDENYFVGRYDLEEEGLQWGNVGGSQFLELKKFKTLMRIELRKSVSSQLTIKNKY
jgi:hypothetical protein